MARPGQGGADARAHSAGRFVQPDEVAEAILYLLGDGAGMINGVCLPVDGGFRAV